jgi:exopolyphosphatase/guanosine-5'-triphosphate,3'-diphosphate pyrophosphatase
MGIFARLAQRDTERIVSFIDIGTNSARQLLVRIQPDLSYQVISQRKEAIRLGEGINTAGYLNGEAMQRAITVCQHFTEMANAAGAQEIIAVATSATRDARNRMIFINRLKNEADLDVRVISGLEEARLIYRGAASGARLDESTALFLDIGGGSTELIAGNHSQYFYLDTLDVGAIRLTNRFLPGKEGPVRPKQYRKICNHVRDVSVRAIQALSEFDFRHCVGTSGTIENLADIVVLKDQGRRRTPDDVVNHKQLRKTIEHLCSLSLEERRAVPGINPNRADIIIAGAAILDTLLEDCGVKEFGVSERSLRDGLLVEYLAQLRQDEDFEEPSFRERSVLRLGRAMKYEEPHAKHVAQLAVELFDSAAALGMHTLGPLERELLRYAALLHDIGVSLSYANHHVHSAYFIRNADLLGFNQREIDIIANLARYHRKASPKKKHAEFAALDDGAQMIVRHLCVFLSLAESLDRTHIGAVVSAAWKEDIQGNLILELRCRRDCPLEQWGVNYHEKAFRRVFQRKLQFQAYPV